MGAEQLVERRDVAPLDTAHDGGVISVADRGRSRSTGFLRISHPSSVTRYDFCFRRPTTAELFQSGTLLL
jgi:hypothetical protein